MNTFFLNSKKVRVEEQQNSSKIVLLPHYLHRYFFVCDILEGWYQSPKVRNASRKSSTS